MKTIKITEAKFVSLLNNVNNDNFYQDGDFTVSNDRMNKAREIFYPWYEQRYNQDKNRIIRQIAFSKTMQMIDNGELKALPQNSGDYYSLRNRRFSKEQVDTVEKQIRPQYENMSLEELYDYMLIEQERSHYKTNLNGKKAIAQLLNNGFFDDYLNGQLKELALWNLGKLNDVSTMLGKLYSKNRFTKKLNILTVKDAIRKTCDEIADTDDDFMFNPTFVALDAISSSIAKLDRKP